MEGLSLQQSFLKRLNGDIELSCRLIIAKSGIFSSSWQTPHRDCTCVTQAVAVAIPVDMLKSRAPFLSCRLFQNRAYYERCAPFPIQHDDLRKLPRSRLLSHFKATRKLICDQFTQARDPAPKKVSSYSLKACSSYTSQEIEDVIVIVKICALWRFDKELSEARKSKTVYIFPLVPSRAKLVEYVGVSLPRHEANEVTYLHFYLVLTHIS